MAIQLFFLQHNISLRERNALKAFIPAIFKMEKRKLQDLSYIFCSDDYLLNINKANLRHDYYTDIITFDLSDAGGAISGEIYISTDRVRYNAQKLSVTIKEEIHRVIFHGVLHLCGYKDKTQKHKKEMRLAEDKYLDLYFRN